MVLFKGFSIDTRCLETELNLTSRESMLFFLARNVYRSWLEEGGLTRFMALSTTY